MPSGGRGAGAESLGASSLGWPQRASSPSGGWDRPRRDARGAGGHGRNEGRHRDEPLRVDPWIAALAAAVATGTVDARYRPVFDLPSGEVRGAEAVAVWPGGGEPGASDDRLASTADHPPDVAAAVGAALQQVAQRVVEEFALGVAQTNGWWASVAFDRGLVASPEPVQRLASVLERSGFPGQRLVVELTEGALSRGLANGTVDRLGSVGVRFAAVDFGAGAITPADLRRIPMAYVRVSVGGLSVDDPYDLGLVRSVVAAAEALGITVLGDGIETDEQLELANRSGIGLVQGYRWGSPGPLAKLSSTWARLP